MSQIWGLSPGKDVSVSSENCPAHYTSRHGETRLLRPYTSTLRAGHQMTYYWQFTQPRSKCHHGGSCDFLQDSEEMWSFNKLLTLGECCSLWLSRYFCQWGRCGWCIVHIHKVQWGERGGQKAEKTFVFKSFLFFPKIWSLFHNSFFKQWKFNLETWHQVLKELKTTKGSR